MNINTYSDTNLQATSIYNFYGLNRTRRGSRGEFEDMKNMSTLEYPCAAPRGSRETVVTKQNIQLSVAPDSTNVREITEFTGIADEKFYYNGVVKSDEYILHNDYTWEIERISNLYVINGYIDDSLNGKISVLYYYNVDTDEFSVLGKTMDSLILTSGTNEKGNYLATYRFGYNKVYNYVAQNDDGTKIIKNEDFFNQYGGKDKRILPSSNIFENIFQIGEDVTITGFPDRENNIGQVWQYSVGNDEITAQKSLDYHYNNTVDISDMVDPESKVDKYTIVKAIVDGFDVVTYSISGVGKVYIHYIYFKLYNLNGDLLDFDNMELSSSAAYCSGITITNITRTFNNIGIHQNRIIGTAPSGNYIYISSADNNFDFSDDDVNNGYAARLTSDTPGVFTAITSYNGEAIAFKEDSITIIYGSDASNYAATNIYGIGCIDGRSVATTYDGVIFLAYNGFYVYSGATPTCISSKLNKRYISAVAGFDGNIYYASAVTEDGSTELLTYDTRYGTWHIQDNLSASAFYKHLFDFYITSGDEIYKVNSGNEQVEWSFTGIRTHDNTLDNKAIIELWVRADVEDGAYYTVYTCSDDGEWNKHNTCNTVGLNVCRIPVRFISGNNYRYKIEGKGKVVFYEIEIKKAETGRRYKSRVIRDKCELMTY